MYISITAIEEAIDDCNGAVASALAEIEHIQQRIDYIRREAEAHRNAQRQIHYALERAMPAEGCEGPVDWASVEQAMENELPSESGIDWEAEFDMIVREYYDRQGHPEAYYDEKGNPKPNPFDVFCDLVQTRNPYLYGTPVAVIKRVLRGTWAYAESRFGCADVALDDAADHVVDALQAVDAA